MRVFRIINFFFFYKKRKRMEQIDRRENETIDIICEFFLQFEMSKEKSIKKNNKNNNNSIEIWFARH